MESTQQKGGGFLKKLLGLNSNDSYEIDTGYHLTAEQKKLRDNDYTGRLNYNGVVESEDDLIRNYEKLARVSRNYYASYNRHLNNLITLDDKLGIQGLEKTFKNQVIKNVFKGNDIIDRSNPLLLRNFLVSNSTLPRNFRKEHLLSQIRYILRKFNPKDELLIQSVDVSLEGNKAIIKLHGLNGDLYERSAAIDEDFNLDMNDLKRNIKEVLLSIKRKMDFEIEIVSDFKLDSEDMDVPGLNFLDDENALERRLKDLEMRRTLNPAGPVPISQMSPQKKSDAAAKRPKIFGISPAKPKQVEIPLLAAATGIQIPGDQGFGEQRAIEKKPFIVEDAINKILQGGPTAFNPEVANPAPTAAPNPAAGMMQPFAGIQPAAGMNTRDELEKKCNDLTSQPDVCSKTLGCFYNTKLNPPKCHKDKKI